jgi:hypothetical protein
MNCELIGPARCRRRTCGWVEATGHGGGSSSGSAACSAAPRADFTIGVSSSVEKAPDQESEGPTFESFRARSENCDEANSSARDWVAQTGRSIPGQSAPPVVELLRKSSGRSVKRLPADAIRSLIVACWNWSASARVRSEMPRVRTGGDVPKPTRPQDLANIRCAIGARANGHFSTSASLGIGLVVVIVLGYVVGAF